ncbi:c-type cytochrome [Thiofilum flexile]|uniref:c-type cytochrome n=1 Tax=Thiofilum flexile TaxID=125627 RepID=UPI00037B05F4|nr:cytochrome c [Thiofilum flexile]
MERVNYISLLVLALWLVGCDNKEDTRVSRPTSSTIEVSDAQIQAGKAIHDKNCISCHDSSVYTRLERRINNYSELLAQVRRCDANLSARLFDEEIQQVTLYLNQTYYQFDLP